MLLIDYERAKGYGEIFALVKKAVENSLGEHRVGLMLFLGNLPLNVGAFHPLGTNDIVLNRRLLMAVKSEQRNKAQIFSILLHEYLHTLEDLVPIAQPELHFITEQYVSARYSPSLPTEKELYQLRQSWYQVRRNRLKEPASEHSQE